jgi:competence protein ComEC
MVLLMASFFPYHEQPRRGHFRVHVLDVGQGLSVAVRTQHHLLIYDTGVKFYQGSDMGQLVIVPFLHIAGLKKIDKLVISHPDLDHRGGLASIIKEIPTAELIVNDQAFYQHGKNCHNYPAWHWDGVDFQFLPIRAAFREKNNLCCVLKITNHQKSLLLPGDIEAQAEAYLYKNYFNALASSFLVVPHHGSRTSSSPAFIRAVGAQYAVISAAFDNRFHFPHQETIRTLRHYHTHIYNTMSCGMVTWDSEKNQPPQCYRPVG